MVGGDAHVGGRGLPEGIAVVDEERMSGAQTHLARLKQKKRGERLVTFEGECNYCSVPSEI